MGRLICQIQPGKFEQVLICQKDESKEPIIWYSTMPNIENEIISACAKEKIEDVILSGAPRQYLEGVAEGIYNYSSNKYGKCLNLNVMIYQEDTN